MIPVKDIENAKLSALEKELFLNGAYEQLMRSVVGIAVSEDKNNEHATFERRLLAERLFSEKNFEKLGKFADQRYAKEKEFWTYRIWCRLSDIQREVMSSPNKRKILMCGRRAGKTELIKTMLADCLHNKKLALYVGNKPAAVVAQVEEPLHRFLEMLGEPFEHNRTEHVFTCGEGSVKLVANTSRAEIEGLRGGKYHFVCVDECQSQRNQRTLFDEVITPMLLDYDGQLMISGTAPRIPNTYQEACWNSEAYSKWNWNARRNPFITGDVEKFYKEVLEAHAWTTESPIFQREYLGMMVYDTEARVIPKWSTCDKLNFKPTEAAIGVDLGFVDRDAVAALVMDSQGHSAIVYAEQHNKQGLDALGRMCVEARETAAKYGLSRDQIRFWMDDNEQRVLLELNQKYGLPCHTAVKYDKTAALQHLRDLFGSGKIQAHADVHNAIKLEFDSWVYQRDDNENIVYQLDDDTYHADLGMAILYASRRFMQLNRYEYETVVVPEILTRTAQATRRFDPYA